MTKKAAIFTLGCRANQYDELVIRGSLEDAGFEIVPFDEPADLYVINTCTVTHRGDADSRKAARNAHRRNPDAFIVMAGCYSHWASEKIIDIEGVDLVLGNREKMEISRYLPENLVKQQNPLVLVSNTDFTDAFGKCALIPSDKSRALLKIQEGCNQCCSYCIVPHVRGNPRSLERAEVLSRISELVISGFKEVVLTGINLGMWGRETGENLESLVRDIDDLDGEFRIRLSSIEPMELTDELVDILLDSTRICRHLHVPIQNGCDRVLADMRRTYSVGDIARVFDRIKSADPGWNLGTDLVIGFPGETKGDFDEQISNLSRLPVNYYHLFTFSPRKGTIASTMAGKVPVEKVKSRLEILKIIDRESRRRFIESQLDSILTFVIEKGGSENRDTIMGLSDNYIRASLTGIGSADSGLVRARLIMLDDQTPVATLDVLRSNGWSASN